MAAARAKNHFTSGVDAGMDMRGIGESYADTMNAEKNSAYTLVDARLGFDQQRFMPGASLGMNTNNLTDKRYVLCQDGYCYRGLAIPSPSASTIVSEQGCNLRMLCTCRGWGFLVKMRIILK